MANLAVLASGNGTNFQAIVETVAAGPHHVCCLVCDKPHAYVLDRAARLGVPSHVVQYRGRSRKEAEQEILGVLMGYGVDLVALAGYMRLLSPQFVDAYPQRIVNIHPSLLPKYPGTHAIAESYQSGDLELGITVHTVDYGMDSGPVIVQESFPRNSQQTLEQVEERIHRLEHATYPKVIISLLDKVGHYNRTTDVTGRIIR